jgi:hypothetical protein
LDVNEKNRNHEPDTLLAKTAHLPFFFQGIAAAGGQGLAMTGIRIL